MAMPITVIALCLFQLTGSDDPIGDQSLESVPPFHTPHGVFRLTDVPDFKAYRVDRESVATKMQRTHKSVRPLLGKRMVWLDSPSAATLTAFASDPALTALRAYRVAESGALMLSDGRVVLRFSPDADTVALARDMANWGVIRSWIYDRRRRLMRLEVSPERALSISAALHARPDVEWAEPDFIHRIEQTVVPNDPLLAQQWHLPLIAAEPGWEIESGSSEIRIAILDSGVDLTHPDLVGKLVDPRDTENLDDDPTPDASEAHGTACAGLAAATGDNAQGVAGVCLGCSIVPVRVFSGTGFGRAGAESDGILWALDRGAAVISNSWGPAEAVPISFSLDLAITEAALSGRDGLGAIVVFAAGNSARAIEEFELAAHPMVVSVGASGQNDLRELFSNFGPSLGLLAPAGAVTTDSQGSLGYTDGDYMTAFGGTSAAAPVAAGVMGLMLSADPHLTRGQVVSALMESADQIGAEGYIDGRNDFYGAGRLNALRAISRVVDGELCVPTAEACNNGLDDDCDLLVDNDDPSCAPGRGELCGVDPNRCRAGHVCLSESPGSERSRCFLVCDSTTDCEDDVCLPLSNDLSVCAQAGRVACPSCGDDVRCDQNSVCVAYADLSLSLCTQTCETSDQCPLGFFCAASSAGDRACAPLSFSCSPLGPAPGAPCAADDSCALGSVCTSAGRCARVCREDDDCLDSEMCSDSAAAGLRFCVCGCDLSDGCDTGCDCDFACVESCQCDASDECDPGCPCDLDCSSDVACDEDRCDETCRCNEDLETDVQSDGCSQSPLPGLWIAMLYAMRRGRLANKPRRQ